MSNKSRNLSPMVTRAYNIVVTGSREWTDYNIIMRQLALAFERAKTLGFTDIAVHQGECPYGGADALAKEFINKEEDTLKAYGLTVRTISHPPQFHKHGKPAAYHVRNQEMIDLKPDEVLAFRIGGDQSRGTTSVIKYARSKGIEPTIIEA